MKAIVRGGLLASPTKPSFVEDLPEPSSEQKGKVTVKVRCAALNPVDYKMPSALLGNVYGLDVSGVVVASGVDDFKVGDKVVGMHMGSMTEKIVASPNHLTPKVDELSFAEAAALPVAYLTAWQSIVQPYVKKATGDGLSILIIGASGGCGLAGVHLCAALDDKLKRIAGVCSGKNAEFVKTQGATEVIDYTDKEALEKFWTDNAGMFDFVYDTATGSGHGEAYTALSMPLLKEAGGHYVTLNGGMGSFLRNITTSKHSRFLMTMPKGSDLKDIQELLASSKRHPQVQKLAFTEEGMKEGFDLLQSRRARGKIVFEVSADS